MLGREQQYLPDVRGGGVASYVQARFASHNQLSTSLAPPSWRWLTAESLLLPETPWLEPPSWRRRWLATESLSLLEIPSQELVVSGQYSIVSHKFFTCLSESLGIESASHQQSVRVQFCMKLQSCQEVNMTGLKRPGVEELIRKAWRTTPHE